MIGATLSHYRIIAIHSQMSFASWQLVNIRGEERFKKLMKKVKHDWERFEV